MAAGFSSLVEEGIARRALQQPWRPSSSTARFYSTTTASRPSSRCRHGFPIFVVHSFIGEHAAFYLLPVASPHRILVLCIHPASKTTPAQEEAVVGAVGAGTRGKVRVFVRGDVFTCLRSASRFAGTKPGAAAVFPCAYHASAFRGLTALCGCLPLVRFMYHYLCTK